MTEKLLKEIVAGVARVDHQQITAATSLADILHGSLGRARLDAEVRARLGISSPAVYQVATYGDLQSALGLGDPAAPNHGEPRDLPSPVVTPLNGIAAPNNGIAVGVDVELIASLPVVADYWEDEFYRRMFTSQEIAYALLQPQPRASLAAAWCAKEALRKARAGLANVEWARIEVVHDPAGKPSLQLDGAAVPGSLSLSHTEEIAVAVFASYAPTMPLANSISLPAAITAVPVRKRSPVVAAAAWLALLMAAASIAVQLLRP
jgi:phosphopantetheine--protein transferase-like protein